MITRDLLLKHAPHARPVYLDSFDASSEWLERTGITGSRLRTAHFLAQAIHSSGGLYDTVESLWFTAREISERWPRLYPNAGDALTVAGREPALAEAIYGNRIGNVAGTEDAWRYRARGIFRIVGRNNYAGIGKMIGAPLIDEPDLVISKAWAVACAVTIWNLRSGSLSADSDDCVAVTRRMGGTDDDLVARLALVKQIKADLGI